MHDQKIHIKSLNWGHQIASGHRAYKITITLETQKCKSLSVGP
jgi:hypothetical protein